MKRIYLLLLGLPLTVASVAQVSKGTKLAGVSLASVGYTSSNSTTSYSNTPTLYKSEGSSFSLGIQPNVAFFIRDRLAVGGLLSAGFYRSSSTSSNTSSTTTSENKSSQPSVYIGPMARYYFGGSAKGMPFVQANAQYGISGGKSESKTSTGASSETTTKPQGDWNAGALVGYEHFINQSIGAFASVGVNYGKSKTQYEYRPSTGSGYDYTSEYSRVYVPVSIGLQVHIPPRGK